MDRRDFLKLTGSMTAAIALESLFASLARGQEGKPRPNILFLFSDDHAVRAMSPYSDLLDTPNLNRIAKEGATFDQNFCANSLCGPSRANVLTGKHSWANKFLDNSETAKFDGAQQTYPKLLQKAGYQTAVFGKWHLNSDPTGFDAWEILPGQGNYYNPDFITAAGKKRVPGYVTDIIADRTIQWLDKERDKSKPFMLHCWHKAPHRPWMPPLNKLEMFKDKTFPEPENLFDDYSNRASPASKNKMTMSIMQPAFDLKLVRETDTKLPGEYVRMDAKTRAEFIAGYKKENDEFFANPPTGKALTSWRFQRYMKDYLRCISSLDDNIGKVLKYLDDNGLAENTIVVYSADQGFYLGEHGWFDKRWMYEESFRMPLLMRWPGVIKPGTRISAMTQSIDFGPTFLDAAGVTVPADMHGVSLRPLLDGKTPENWRKSLYYHYYEHPGEHNVARHLGVRTDRYKLIWYYETDEWEFFDLQSDPHEMKSLYADPAYAPQIQELRAELERLKKQYGEENAN